MYLYKTPNKHLYLYLSKQRRGGTTTGHLQSTTANFLNLISNLLMCPRFSFVFVLTVISKVNKFRASRDS